MKKNYDLVISLGGNCSVAMQLIHRGLRHFSLPLDWTFMTDDKPVKYLVNAFENSFADFCKWENCEQFSPVRIESGVIVNTIQDKKSGYVFSHHFNGEEFSQESFLRSRAKIGRRISRLMEKLQLARRVLFCLATPFTYDISLAERIHHSIRKSFPCLESEMRLMLFSAQKNDRVVMDNGKIEAYYYERDFNPIYDNEYTSCEWSWMDEIAINYVMPPNRLRHANPFRKLKYKLWCHLGRDLRTAGAACVNMKFAKPR